MTNQRMHEILVPAIAEKLLRGLHQIGKASSIATYCYVCQGKHGHSGSRGNQQQSASSKSFALHHHRCFFAVCSWKLP